jgi:hypothetical protein
MKYITLKQMCCLFLLIAMLSCKVKRCANFENQDSERKLKYDRHGRVKR